MGALTTTQITITSIRAVKNNRLRHVSGVALYVYNSKRGIYCGVTSLATFSAGKRGAVFKHEI